MNNTYVNVCITYRATYREIICSWEYFQTTVIQNQCTLIWHSKNDKLKSKNRTKKEVSLEFILNFLKKKISKPNFSVYLWGRMYNVSEMSFSRLKMRQMYLKDLNLRAETMTGCIRSQEFVSRNRKTTTVACGKAWLPKDKVQQGLEAPKKQTNKRSWPKNNFQNEISTNSIFSFLCSRHRGSHFLMLKPPGWTSMRWKKEEDQKEHWRRWEKNLLAVPFLPNKFRIVSTQIFFGTFKQWSDWLFLPGFLQLKNHYGKTMYFMSLNRFRSLLQQCLKTADEKEPFNLQKRGLRTVLMCAYRLAKFIVKLNPSLWPSTFYFFRTPFKVS